MSNPDEQILDGTIERVVFFNEENGYVVARLLLDRGEETATIVGNIPGLREGEHVRARGSWEESRKFGPQFKVSNCEIIPPSSAEGIEKYLASGLIRGIGPVMAERIVGRFGADTLRIISDEPDRLREVPGIGRKTLEKIIASWKEHQHLRETMVFLQAQGISPIYATKIIKQYGGATVGVVREQPYRLSYDIHGIGFKQADSIARKMGIPHDSPERAAAGVMHVLTETAGEGHVYYPARPLLDRCSDMLDIPLSQIEAGVETLRRERKIVAEEVDGEQALYLTPLYAAETGAARLLREMIGSLKLMPPIDADKAAAWFEKRRGITLNDRQREAIRKAVDSKVLVITGGPGTGKTTLVRALVDIFSAKRQRVQLAAPTGRAAKRMEEVAGIAAATIHRLLEFSPARMNFVRDKGNPLECDVLVIDESSMLDIALFYHLLKATPPEASVIFMGDADQLPSVGPGNVLRDLIRSRFVDVIELDEIFRQAEGSLIITNAHRINRGEEPIVPLGDDAQERDFHFIERATPEEVAATIETLVTDRIPSAFGIDPLLDIQVLSPMHKGIAGVSDLNSRLQGLLNPSGRELAHGSRKFRARDKVMQVRNNYDKDVFNGDVGLILSIDHDARQLAVDFDGRIIAYEYSELDELELAYAISIHKSQGSEYRAVVVPVIMQHYILLQRNLIYTAATRGKELVVFVGTKDAFSTAIKNVNIKRRHTHLAGRLRG